MENKCEAGRFPRLSSFTLLQSFFFNIMQRTYIAFQSSTHVFESIAPLIVPLAVTNTNFRVPARYYKARLWRLCDLYTFLRNSERLWICVTCPTILCSKGGWWDKNKQFSRKRTKWKKYIYIYILYIKFLVGSVEGIAKFWFAPWSESPSPHQHSKNTSYLSTAYKYFISL